MISVSGVLGSSYLYKASVSDIGKSEGEDIVGYISEANNQLGNLSFDYTQSLQ